MSDPFASWQVSRLRAGCRLALSVAAVGLATLALVPIQWLALRIGLRDRQRAPKLWNRAVLGALGWRMRVEGQMVGQRPLLLVSNHVSWSDVVVLAAHAAPGFIAKQEVAGWPLFGLLAKLHDTVFIDRERKSSAGRQVTQVGERVARGDALVLFPEGTTGDGIFLLPFKTALFGAIEAASDSKTVCVQPVAIAYPKLHGLPAGRRGALVAAWTGDETLATHLWRLACRGPLDVTLHFGEPLPLAPGEGRKVIAAQAERAIRELLRQSLRG